MYKKTSKRTFFIISGGVVRFDGIRYPIYRDLQGIFGISAPSFSTAAPNFRDFYKIPHKNNREFDFTKQGFYQHTSGNNHTPPPPRYRLGFIWLLLEKLCVFIYSFEYKYKNLLPILTTDCIYSHE